MDKLESASEPPQTELRFYRTPDSRCPFLEWLGSAHPRLRAKVWSRLEALAEHGHCLGRPHSALLRDGIRELRFQQSGVQFRILYFFAGPSVAVISHVTTKLDRVPERHIDLAVARREELESR